MMSETLIDVPINDIDYGYVSKCGECANKIYTKDSLASNKCFRCRGIQAPEFNTDASRGGVIDDYRITSHNNKAYERS